MPWRQMQYDPFVALPRLSALFSEAEVPVTWFVPGWVIDTYRPQMDILLNGRDEIAHHGYLHDWPNEQNRAAEKDALQAGIASIMSLTGQPPVGYRAPYYGVSRHTFDLLIEAGFEYDSSLFADDVPIELEGTSGTLLELPPPATIDDFNQYVSSRAFDYLMKVSPPREALEVFRADFDALWEIGGLWISVWHPAVSGRPAQAVAVRELVQHMQEKGNVWFATLREISAHIRLLQVENRWTPRKVKVPFYRE